MGTQNECDELDNVHSVTVGPPVALGGGQANSAAARLEVDCAPTGVTPGPFAASLEVGGQLTLRWSGPPAAALLLAAGPLAPGALPLPGIGSLDLGAPLDFLFNGLAFPGSLVFVLDASGFAEQSFTLPPGLPGPFADIQGAVAAPGGVVLTSAWSLSVQ